jgi:hypothetical protein
VQAVKLLVQEDEAGLFGKDPIEARPHHPGAPGCRIAFVGLQIPVKPPDQGAAPAAPSLSPA